jgi:hypothetical protein
MNRKSHTQRRRPLPRERPRLLPGRPPLADHLRRRPNAPAWARRLAEIERPAPARPAAEVVKGPGS